MDSLKNYIGGYYNHIAEAQQSTFTVILELVILAVVILAAWKLFTKAGEPGWVSLIPFYNTYTLFKISMGNGWFFILLFLPLVNVIAGFLLAINLARCFGKSVGYAAGLFFFPYIFMILLGFGDAQYLGPKGIGDFRPDEDFRRRTVNMNDFTTSDDSNAQTVDFEVINSDEE
ncbi:MAG: DUF5684 domain-containing protein [Firmicutes bacterium]|nr:DUF5684 domain-containing protein [Bacillota bacterium]